MLQEQTEHCMFHLLAEEEWTGFANGYLSTAVEVLEENVKETSKDTYPEVTNRLGLRKPFLLVSMLE